MTQKVVASGQVIGQLHRVRLADVNRGSLDPLAVGVVALPSSFVDLDPLSVERVEVCAVAAALSDVGDHWAAASPYSL